MSELIHKKAYAVPVSRAAVAADFPSFSCSVFKDPPGQVWSDFTHNTDEFVVVAAGEVEIEVAGKVAQCGPGDLVLIPARTPHTLRTSPTGGSTWFYGYGRFGDSDG